MNSLKKKFHFFLIVVFAVGFSACEVESDLGMSKGKSAGSNAQVSSSDPQVDPSNPQTGDVNSQSNSSNPQASSPASSPKSSPPVSPVYGKALYWNAPQRYDNGTILDPEIDLQGYEIFVKRNSKMFSTNDEPVLFLSAIDTSGNLIQSFTLTDLDYTFSTNQTYYLCVRSITKSGLVSTFSSVVELRI